MHINDFFLKNWLFHLKQTRKTKQKQQQQQKQQQKQQ